MKVQCHVMTQFEKVLDTKLSDTLKKKLVINRVYSPITKAFRKPRKNP